MTLSQLDVVGTKYWRCVAILGAIIGLAACKPSASDQDPRTEAQFVEVTTVQAATPDKRGYTGVIAAHVQSNLGFRVAGKVTERFVDAGQTIRKGQPLMRLDHTDFEHAITVQAGNVAAAKARLIQAAADEARFNDLISSGAVSRSAYDQAKAAADGARALLSAAEAQLKLAQDDGAYSTLVADADGTVVETLAEPGQYVAAGQIVLRLAHSGPREVAVNLPETARPKIGSTAVALLYGSGGPITAKLRQLSDAADPVTRTFEARYVLDGAAAQAPLGATATIYLPASEPQGEMAIPLGAIDDEGHGSGVWILDTKTSSVLFRPVHVIRLEAERAILSDGVRVGNRIVALGGHYLHDGERVRIFPAQVALK